MPSTFDVTHGNAAQEPLVAEGAGGAKAKMIGVGVGILIILALVGGVVAWIVLGHHGDRSTTPGPPGSTTRGPRPEPSFGGAYCAEANWDGNCEQCEAGHVLSDAEGLANRCFYKCETDLHVHVVKGEHKGLCLDDTTHEWCSDNLPFHWPNTNEPVKSIRMFKAWQNIWTEQAAWLNKTEAWENLARYLKHSGAKVLVGTQVTCDPDDDDSDWEDVMTMMTMFGPEAIMGVAIGNEMELLWQKDLTDADGNDIWNDCMDRMWMPQPAGKDPYFRQVFKSRVHDLSQMPGFENVPLTSVFGGAVFAGDPFVNMPWTQSDEPYGHRPNVATVLDFLIDIVPRVNDRWKWSLNIYPYFDPGNTMDPDGVHCKATIARGTCFDEGNAEDCIFSALVASMRQRMASFGATYGGSGGGFEGTLWVGETGWSAPMSATLSTEVMACPEFSSVEVFERYYKSFLSWDMNIPHTFLGETADFKGPDHVFWFTMRDSSNFDKEEHFGLIGDGPGDTWCTNTTCKLNDRHIFSSTVPYTGPSTTTKMTTTSTTTTTTVTHPFRGTPKCCYSNWWAQDPNDDACRYYPTSGRGRGFCNNKWDHTCSDPDADGKCAAITTTIATTTIATTTIATTTIATTTIATTANAGTTSVATTSAGTASTAGTTSARTTRLVTTTLATSTPEPAFIPEMV